MAYAPRPAPMLPPGSSAPSSIRQSSSHHAVTQQQSSALATRIASKKAELDNLKQLRDMSGALAVQMQALEDKLGTLNNGTEAVAHVLTNWDNVLRAISMASTKAAGTKNPTEQDFNNKTEPNATKLPMPATLVRIPAEPEASSSEP